VNLSAPTESDDAMLVGALLLLFFFFFGCHVRSRCCSRCCCFRRSHCCSADVDRVDCFHDDHARLRSASGAAARPVPVPAPAPAPAPAAQRMRTLPLSPRTPVSRYRWTGDDAASGVVSPPPLRKRFAALLPRRRRRRRESRVIVCVAVACFPLPASENANARSFVMSAVVSSTTNWARWTKRNSRRRSTRAPLAATVVLDVDPLVSSSS
jgi:hypothetical protein